MEESAGRIGSRYELVASAIEQFRAEHVETIDKSWGLAGVLQIGPSDVTQQILVLCGASSVHRHRDLSQEISVSQGSLVIREYYGDSVVSYSLYEGDTLVLPPRSVHQLVCCQPCTVACERYWYGKSASGSTAWPDGYELLDAGGVELADIDRLRVTDHDWSDPEDPWTCAVCGDQRLVSGGVDYSGKCGSVQFG